MTHQELVSRIRRIEIFARKAVGEGLLGEYASVFKGCGIEFEEVREYSPGDDVRSIDWNVTARAGRPFVKRFREERELTVVLLVDLSASFHFGTVSRTKRSVATEVCALLAFSAVENNDRVGLIAFTDRVEKFVPPGKGMTHALKIVRNVLALEPTHPGTDIGSALDYLGRVVRKRAVVFLISDFHAEGFERSLRILGRRHDIIAVVLRDRREKELPKAGMLAVEDSETGERLVVDTSSRAFREAFQSFSRGETMGLSRFLRSSGIDQVEMETDSDCGRVLSRFFEIRRKRRKG